MTKQDLQKLGRKDLAGILTDISRENEQLRAELEQVNARLAERTIHKADPGDIGDAALLVTRILEDAQKEAEQYLADIREREAVQRRACLRMEQNALRACRRKKQAAQAQADIYLKQIQAHVQQLSQSYPWQEMNVKDMEED